MQPSYSPPVVGKVLQALGGGPWQVQEEPMLSESNGSATRKVAMTAIPPQSMQLDAVVDLVSEDEGSHVEQVKQEQGSSHAALDMFGAKVTMSVEEMAAKMRKPPKAHTTRNSLLKGPDRGKAPSSFKPQELKALKLKAVRLGCTSCNDEGNGCPKCLRIGLLKMTRGKGRKYGCSKCTNNANGCGHCLRQALRKAIL